MSHVAARMASRYEDAGRYQRHRPEQTLLYQIVDEYYPAFAALMAEQGKELPGYVQREFEEYLQCGPAWGLGHWLAVAGPLLACLAPCYRSPRPGLVRV